MAVSNTEALENLYKQRDQLIEQIRAGETTVLKITGAIEVLEQLKTEEPEVETVEPEVYNLGEESTEESTEE